MLGFNPLSGAPLSSGPADQDIEISIPLGFIVLSGFVPTIQATGFISIDIPTGVISLSGFAPTISLTTNTGVSIPAGTIALQGFAPFVDLGDLTVNVNSATITLSGFAPVVIAEGPVWTIQPSSPANWVDQADNTTTWIIQ